MRLLIVEDDKDLRAFVQEGLTREGFIVDAAAHGKEAVALAMERSYDGIVLDVMMPELDGFSVLKTLRMRGFQGAVVLTTCKGQEQDKLKGLNSGADDYLVKPYLLTELVARVRAVLRRTTAAPGKAIQGSVLKAGGVEMNLLTRLVTKAGKPVALTKREFELLEYLMRRPGQVVSPEILAQHVSNIDYDSQTNTVEVHIKNLRRKIDGKGKKSLIRTSRGFGYAFDPRT